MESAAYQRLPPSIRETKKFERAAAITVAMLVLWVAPRLYPHNPDNHDMENVERGSVVLFYTFRMFLQKLILKRRALCISENLFLMENINSSHIQNWNFKRQCERVFQRSFLLGF